MSNFNLTKTTQEIANYYVQGTYSQSKIFEDQTNTPYANELTLDDQSHDIKSFLRRPIDITNFKWTVNDLQNKELIQDGISLPDALLQYKSVQDKVRNFVGIRGRLMIRVKVNPQPYQQGTLLAYYIPNVKTIQQKVDMIQQSLSGKSGCPGNVEIDGQGASLFDFEIPYVSEFNFYNLLTGQGTYGKFFFAVYLQLRSKTPNDFINITVQSYWKDPQPVFATGVDILVPTQSEQQMLHDNTLETGGSQHVTKDSLITTLMTEEIKPSTVLKTGANLMQLAGYQKPNIETGICQSHLQTAKFMSNYNGEQFSHSLGLSSTNKLEHPPFPACTNEDEMNLSSIVQKSNYYKTFQWNTGDAPKKIIFHDEVYPCKLAPSETSNVYNSTFVAYASSPFAFWKGSMVYHFKLAKTIYHSGSLRVSFVPGLYDEDITDGVVTKPGFLMNMNYSEVYDIKETKEFVFVVPYAATTPALHNINPYSSRAKTVAKRNWCPGSIVIDIFTELVTNETIAVNLIETAVRVSGGSDLEFIGASAPSFFPYSPATVRTQGITNEEGGFRSEEDKKTMQPITGNLKNSFLTSALLSGECVTSVKNFLGRMALYGQITGQATSTVLKICPFDFQKPLSATSANVTNFDFIDYFSYLYGWYAGGVNISLYNQANAAQRYYEARMLPGLESFYPTDFSRVSSLSTADATTYDNTLAQLPLPTQVIKSDLEGMAHLMVPYYNRVQITPALTKEQNQNNTEEGSYPTPIVYLKTSSRAGETRVFRSATDSFQFYYLLGPPQVVLLSGTAQLNPFIYPEVAMVGQKQSVTSIEGGTTRVAPFFNLDSVDFVGTDTQTLTPNTQFLTRYQLNNGDPWSLMIVPGGDSYTFTLAGSDIRLAKSGITTFAWNLFNGTIAYSGTTIPSSGFYLLKETDSSSAPIKRSTVSATSITSGTNSFTLSGVNGNQPFVDGKTYILDKDLLLFSDTYKAPFIVKSGSTVRVLRINGCGFYLVDVPSGKLGAFGYIISSFGDDVKYTPGLNPTPYLLNVAL